MRKKLLCRSSLLAILLGAAALPLAAQPEGYAYAYEARYTYEISGPVSLSEKGYATNVWKSNWFVSVGGGVQAHISAFYHQDGGPSKTLWQRSKPLWHLTFGKWMLPAFGMRVHLSGYELPLRIASAPAVFGNAHLDLMWSLLDLGGNYRDTRFLNIIPILGFGTVATFREGSVRPEWGMSSYAGLQFKFRVFDWLSLYLEGSANLHALPESVSPDPFFGLNGGVQYNINNRPFTHRSDLNRYYLDQIESLERALKTEKNRRIEAEEELIRLQTEQAEQTKQPEPGADQVE